MIAESHENVTILFSDIVGFTTIAARYSTEPYPLRPGRPCILRAPCHVSF